MKIKKLVVVSWLIIILILVISSIYAGFTNRNDMLTGLILVTLVIAFFGGLFLWFADFFEDEE